MLSGGLGDDYLTGGHGLDILIGGEGNDKFRGGSGSDIFAFDWTESVGHDRIFDWESDDVISFFGLDDPTFEYVAANMVQEDNGVVFQLSDASSVSIRDTQLSDFNVNNFAFTESDYFLV